MWDRPKTAEDVKREWEIKQDVIRAENKLKKGKK